MLVGQLNIGDLFEIGNAVFIKVETIHHCVQAFCILSGNSKTIDGWYHAGYSKLLEYDDYVNHVEKRDLNLRVLKVLEKEIK